MPKESLPSYPCVRCGYCCTVAPCLYGRGVPCLHLRYDGLVATCAVWDHIQALERDLPYPMGECGCSSSIANAHRIRLVCDLPRR